MGKKFKVFNRSGQTVNSIHCNKFHKSFTTSLWGNEITTEQDKVGEGYYLIEKRLHALHKGRFYRYGRSYIRTKYNPEKLSRG